MQTIGSVRSVGQDGTFPPEGRRNHAATPGRQPTVRAPPEERPPVAVWHRQVFDVSCDLVRTYGRGQERPNKAQQIGGMAPMSGRVISLISTLAVLAALTVGGTAYAQ